MKRFLCTLMALAMTLALAVPAFAVSVTSANFTGTGTDGSDVTRTLDGHTEAPIIKVYLPADTGTDKLILNPYGLKVSSSAVISGGSGDLTDQVISKATFIGSLSNVPLQIGMKVVATPASGVTLASKSLKDDTKTTTKSVFLWGQVVGADKGGTVPTLDKATFSSDYDATAGKSGDMILVASGTTGVTRTGMYTIPAAESTTDISKVQWACAKFFGDAVKAPTSPWTSSDTVKLTVTFTFTASMNEAS